MSSTALDVKAYRPPESRSGTITSWIPLVTPYSMFADGCTSAFWRHQAGGQIVAWDPGYGISVDTNLRCVPEAVTTWWDQDRLGPNSETVVSIGPLTCPEHYKTVATSPQDASSTQVACCPSDYTFSTWIDRGAAHQCYSSVGSGTIITVYTSNDYQEWDATTLTSNTTTTVLAAHINGWVFAEETGSAECAASESNNSSTTGSGALSTGDKVGIGIGVGMGVIGLATLAVGLFMVRRARRFHPSQHREEQKQEHQQEQQQQQQMTHEGGSSWNPPFAQLGTHRDSAAAGARYVAPPSELYST